MENARKINRYNNFLFLKKLFKGHGNTFAEEYPKIVRFFGSRVSGIG